MVGLVGVATAAVVPLVIGAVSAIGLISWVEMGELLVFKLKNFLDNSE